MFIRDLKDCAEIISKRHIPLFLTSAAGAAFVLAASSRFGICLSSDSVNYMAAANSLLASGRMAGCGGEPFVSWPPLLPLVLAPFGLAGLDIFNAARYLNAFLFGSIVFMAGYWLEQKVIEKSGWLSAFVLFSWPLFEASLWLQSEPLFVFWSLLFFFSIDNYRVNGNKGPLIMSAAFASVATLTRYVGLSLTAAGLVVIATKGGKTPKERLADAVPFSSVALLPSIAWMSRNWMLSASLAGERPPSSFSTAENFFYLTDTLRDFFARNAGSGFFYALLGLFLLILIGFGRDILKELYRSSALPLLVFAAAFAGIMITASSAVAFNRINWRLLSPLYIPLFLLGAHAFCVPWKRIPKGAVRKNAGFLALAVLALYLAQQYFIIASLFNSHLEIGDGFASAGWRNSRLAQKLPKELPDGVVICNAPEVFYFYTGRQALASPRKHAYNSPMAAVDDVSPLKEVLRRGKKVYLVWFDGTPPEFIYNLSELLQIFKAEKVSGTSDGSVFRLYGDRNAVAAKVRESY